MTDVELTPRQWQVAECLAYGLSRKATAAHLGITVGTVDRHMQDLGDRIPGHGSRIVRIVRYAVARQLRLRVVSGDRAIGA